MKGLESAPLVEGGSEFDLPAGDSFDVNAAFQQAIQGVASSEELALDEKVRRMETIVAEEPVSCIVSLLTFGQWQRKWKCYAAMTTL